MRLELHRLRFLPPVQVEKIRRRDIPELADKIHTKRLHQLVVTAQDDVQIVLTRDTLPEPLINLGYVTDGKADKAT